MTDQTPGGRSIEANQLYAEWLTRQREASDEGNELAGSPASVDALCAQHPEHAAALHALHADYLRIASLLLGMGRARRAAPGDGATVRPGLPEPIHPALGASADPGTALDAQEANAAQSRFPSEVLARLTTRPDTSGRYRIEGELARGGQGVILSIWDEDLRRRLAMKVTFGAVHSRADPESAHRAAAPPDAPWQDAASPPVNARSVGRFLEEAQVTSQLDHPGIVPVHELGLDRLGRVFFTMKLVKGEDLQAVFARVHAGEQEWSQTRAVSLLLRVSEAMSYAHSKQVIHRDLKPSNIMVGRYGEVFVMDWGLARVLDRKDDKDIRVRPQEWPLSVELSSERRERAASDPGSSLFTMDGDVLGTPAYMSPEQASGRLEDMGPKSDVYALGATLYHLLTGRMPYVVPGASVDNFGILHLVQQGPPAPVASLAPQTPAELIAICDKAMAREPAGRYADMSALADDLRAYLERRVVAAHETGAVAELRKWVVRNKPLAAALAAGVLLLASGLTASLLLKAASDRNAQVALEQERLATRKTNDVLSLSAIQELNDLVKRASKLWPAEPQQVPAYDRWLAEARMLIEGAPADPARGLPSHPGLADHESKLAEIRQRALPLEPSQVDQDRRASPHFAEWEEGAAKLLWTRRMLGEEPWPSESEVEARLATETLPADAEGLNQRVWPLVGPEASASGNEVENLILARRAVALAEDSERAAMRDTLAWALSRRGQLEESLAESEHALEECDASQKAQFEDSLAQLQKTAARWIGDEARAARSGAAERLAVRVAGWERDVTARRTFEFTDPQDSWWHEQLSDLVLQLKSFTDAATGLFSSGTSEKHGWGITLRAHVARTIEAKTVSGPVAAGRWAEAIGAIAKSPVYGGLVLSPQMGLLPIGADGESGLWEFWHVPSGSEPLRGADGKLVLTETMGVVLVLIPGGAFWMGAQLADPTAENYDPLAASNETPVHEVQLSPYLLSKYEMTQAQWGSFTGTRPSQYMAGRTFGKQVATLLNPVENVSWDDAMAALPRLGLELPTEAQWERAARAGTTTAWSSGSDRASLEGAANLADQTAARAGASWRSIDDWPELDDGWPVHARVGSFRPNAFGLHDVHGNVWELCRDGYDMVFYGASPLTDPCREVAIDRNRSVRGGGYQDDAVTARSANRDGSSPENPDYDVGLRPARGITP